MAAEPFGQRAHPFVVGEDLAAKTADSLLSRLGDLQTHGLAAGRGSAAGTLDTDLHGKALRILHAPTRKVPPGGFRGSHRASEPLLCTAT
jgi:hypothetical protein